MSQIVVEAIENFGLSKKDRQRTMFSKIGVVGCGKEGQNIVGIAASSGMDVVFLELSAERIDIAFDGISRNLDTKVENWGLTASEKKTVLSRISGTLNYEDLADCDFVVECTRHDDQTGERNHSFRKEVFAKLESILSEDAIIATNSSMIFISELAADLQIKERCISVNFLVSQPESKIIEVARSLYTSDEVYNRVIQFAKLIKFEPITVQEVAGLVSMRLFVVMLNEACQMLLENVAGKEDIERMMNLGWGYRIGIFHMADRIGIEKVVAFMESMFDEFGDKKYKPNPMIMRLYRAKHLGVRNGRGFYNYMAE